MVLTVEKAELVCAPIFVNILPLGIGFPAWYIEVAGIYSALINAGSNTQKG